MYVSMKDMLNKANQENYAVMAINCFNIETARSVINAAQIMRAPIIINIVQEHLQYHCDSNLIAPIIKKLAQRASVEVALNLDHGQDITLIKRAIIDGFSSVMIDASKLDLETNIKLTNEVTKLAQAYNVSVEGEVGTITEVNNNEEKVVQTNIDEAIKYCANTNIDALAISFGSSHGVYEDGYIPKFDFTLLKELKSKISIPLVLHGGSGSGTENIKKAVELGINKINVGCDFMDACTSSIKRQLQENEDINYWVMMHQVEKDAQAILIKYIELSKSKGKSL